MTTGTQKNEGLLKIAIAICVLFSAVNLAGLVYSHIPPFAEGECFVSVDEGFTAVVGENSVLGGYSEVTTKSDSDGIQKGLVSFVELSNPDFKKVKCQ